MALQNAPSSLLKTEVSDEEAQDKLYDFCINCNTVFLHESSKISKIVRVMSSHRTLPLLSSSSTDRQQVGIKNKMQVSLLAAISKIFNLENITEKHSVYSVCEKCGKLLEIAYNAILDFVELTRRGSVLKSLLLKRSKQSAKFEEKKKSPCKNDNNEPVISKRSQRRVKNANTFQVQSSLQSRKVKNVTVDKVGEKADCTEPRSKSKGKFKVCSLCGKRFTSEALFKKHNRLSHNTANDKSVTRKLHPTAINQEKKSAETVIKEEQKLSTEKSSDSDLPFYYCPIRDLEVEKVDSFQQNHEDMEEAENDNSYHAAIKTEDTDDDEDVIMDLDSKLSLEKLKCKLCGGDNNSVIELKEHFSKQHPLVSILTVNDMHNIESNNDLKEELINFNDKNVGETEKISKTSDYSGRFIFNCNVCNKRFIRHDHIKLHLRIHTGEKPFICKEEGCEKAFSDPRGLAYHEITHSNARPYCCKFCGMTFKRLHHLNDHERNHNDVPRRFNCQFCDKAFKHRKHLNSHSVVHQATKEHQCNLCFKSFNRKDNLRQHVRNVHGGKPCMNTTTNEADESTIQVKSKETSEDGKDADAALKLVGGHDAISSATQTVVFHTPSGVITTTTGTIVTGSSGGNDSSVIIKNAINSQEVATSSSVVLSTATTVNKSSTTSNNATGVTNVTIPVAIAITDQSALDQIVYNIY